VVEHSNAVVARQPHVDQHEVIRQGRQQIEGFGTARGDHHAAMRREVAEDAPHAIGGCGDVRNDQRGMEHAAVKLRDRRRRPRGGGGVWEVHFHVRSPAPAHRTSSAPHAPSMPKKKLITRLPLALWLPSGQHRNVVFRFRYRRNDAHSDERRRTRRFGACSTLISLKKLLATS